MASLGEKRVRDDQLNERLLYQLPVAKKKKHTTKFKQAWLKDYQCLFRNRIDEEFVKCCFCGIDINVAEGKCY